MYPAFNFGNLITEREKQLIKEMADKIREEERVSA